MSELPPGITQEDIDNYARIDAAVKKATIAKEALGVRIKEAHVKDNRDKGTYIYGEVVVKIGATTDTDYVALGKSLGPDTNPELYKTVIDPKKVPADIKKIYGEIKPTISVAVAS